MKFIQTSDIHVGECRSFDGYLERHQSVLKQILNIALETGFPLIVPGDIFHLKNTRIEEWFLVFWWLAELEKSGVQTLITTGNHDHMYGSVTQMDGFAKIPFKNIKIIPWEPETYSIGNIGFIGIPWRGYKTKEIEDIVYSKLPEIKDFQYKVVLLHECIVGSKMDSGLVLPKGTKIPDLPEIDYWAIGDIHKKQKANVSNSHYAGAPAQFRFDDLPPKGLLFVDLENPTEPEFVPLVSKQLRTVSSVDEISDDAFYRVKGTFEEVMKANRNEKVVSSDWDKDREQVAFIDPENHRKFEITDGLVEFLAEKGIPEDNQTKAVDWVNHILKGGAGAGYQEVSESEAL